MEYPFTIYTQAKPSKVEIQLPILETPLDISDWAVTKAPNGTPIVESNIWMINSNPSSELETSEDLLDTENISFEELIKLENLPVKITSGFREGSKTKLGRVSYHSKKDSKGNPIAYDIVPLNGNFEELLNIMYSNPRVINWLKSKKYGILEETSPDIMKKTGATGPHLHIGPDSSAVAMTNKRIKKAQSGLKLDFPFTIYSSATIPELTPIKIPTLEGPVDVSDWAISISPSGTPIAESNIQWMTNSNPSNQSDANNILKSSYNSLKSSYKESDINSKIINYFVSKGLSLQLSKGILGNLYGESGLNHRAINKNSKAYGFAQWLGNRKTKLFNRYGKNPSVDLQLDFIWEELQTSEKNALDKLLQASSVEDATYIFMKYFERPSKKEMDNSLLKRILYAKFAV